MRKLARGFPCADRKPLDPYRAVYSNMHARIGLVYHIFGVGGSSRTGYPPSPYYDPWMGYSY